MPLMLTDHQSALVITTSGDGYTSVRLHQGNVHKFGPKSMKLLQDLADELEADLNRISIKKDHHA